MRMKPEIKDTDIITSMDGELPETKGTHPGPSEDSLARDLKKENIKLRSLYRRAPEEIRDLDDMIIKSIENNKVIEYPEEDED